MPGVIGRWRAAGDAKRLLNEGVEHRREGRLPEAEVALADALAAARRSGDRRLLEVCATRVSLSLWRKRRFDEALAIADELIEVRAACFGPTHVRTLDAIENAIRILRQAGRPAQAEPYARRRLDVEAVLHGRHSDSWAYAATTLAWSLREQGRLDEAEVLYHDALAELESRGAQRARVGWPLAGLAVVAQARGDHDAALALLGRARDAWDRDGVTNLANAASERLVDALLTAGRIPEALAESSRFSDRVTRGYVDERDRLRRTERHARVLRAAGREDEARRLDIRIGYLRAAVERLREEEAAARARTGDAGDVGAELPDGEMWSDPAGPVYPVRL